MQHPALTHLAKIVAAHSGAQTGLMIRHITLARQFLLDASRPDYWAGFHDAAIGLEFGRNLDGHDRELYRKVFEAARQ